MICVSKTKSILLVAFAHACHQRKNSLLKSQVIGGFSFSSYVNEKEIFRFLRHVKNIISKNQLPLFPFPYFCLFDRFYLQQQ